MAESPSVENRLARYGASHRHPFNRLCHSLGIPLIVLSLVLLAVGFLFPGVRLWAAAAFVIGWGLQFLGHAVERSRPEFLADWRMLFVGVRWWWLKAIGRDGNP